MKPFSGYKAERQTAREQLPVGAYVAKILAAEVVEYDWGDVLLISFDIIEGEYKDFFANDYKAQTQEDKKWRGTYRLNVPKDDGSEKDGWTKNTFNGAMYAVEQSNPGYHWDWNEAGLKGKLVGVNYREFDWEMEGRTGTSTECGRLETIDDVRSGKCKELKKRELKNKSKPATATTSFADYASGDDDDLPF
jgi:hypothetical protein